MAKKKELDLDELENVVGGVNLPAPSPKDWQNFLQGANNPVKNSIKPTIEEKPNSEKNF